MDVEQTEIEPEVTGPSGQSHNLSLLLQATNLAGSTSVALPLYANLLKVAREETRLAAKRAAKAEAAVAKLEEDLIKGVFPTTLEASAKPLVVDFPCAPSVNEKLALRLYQYKCDQLRTIIEAKRSVLADLEEKISVTGSISRVLVTSIKVEQGKADAANPGGAEALAKETIGILNDWVDSSRMAMVNGGKADAEKELQKLAAKPKAPRQGVTSGEAYKGRPKKPLPKVSSFKSRFVSNKLTRLEVPRKEGASTGNQEKGLEGQGQETGSFQKAQALNKMHLISFKKVLTKLRRKTCADLKNKRNLIDLKRGLGLTKDEIENLSNYGVARLDIHSLNVELTLDDVQVLAVGNKFIPTPEDNVDFSKSFEIFENSMRWAYVFANKPFRPMPEFYIPTGRAVDPQDYCPELEVLLRDFRDTMQLNIFALNKDTKTSNWPKYMNNKVKALTNRKDVIIVPTDKNLGYAAVQTEWYTSQVNNHLEDTRVYQKVEACSLNTVLKSITDLIHLVICYDGADLTSNERRWIYHKGDYKFIPFYILAKVHKDPWSSRPISPSYCWPTYRLSQWLAKKIQAVVDDTDTVLRDSKQLIQELASLDLSKRDFTSKGKKLYLMTADVVSLYPNIDTDKGIEAIDAELKHAGVIFQERKLIKEFLKITLKSNYVEALGGIYRQINGTAMGTPVAPPYANLYLYHLEKNIVDKWKKKQCLLYYKRYIDDICIIFHGRSIEMSKFQHELGNMDEKIKLTWSSSFHSIDFLDLTIFRHPRFKETKKFDTKVFQKTLNRYLYLPAHSYHTKSMKRGFIKGEAIRYARCCSMEKDYDSLITLLTHRLTLRGYSLKFIRDSLSDVSFSQRDTYLVDKSANPQEDRLLFKAEINPNLSLNRLRLELNVFHSEYSKIWSSTERELPRVTICCMAPPKLADSINQSRKKIIN